MAFPRIDEFEKILQSISLVEKGARNSEYLITPESMAKDEKGLGYVIPEIRAFYFRDVDSALDISAIVKKISHELEESGHPANEGIALCVMGLAAIATEPSETVLDKLCEILERKIFPADASQFVLLPTTASEDWRFQVGDFEFGIVNVDRIVYRSTKAGSDYGERYRELLSNRYGIERQVFKTKVIDWDGLVRTVDWAIREPLKKAISVRLIESYFDLISRELFENFWEQLEAEQDLPVAAGAPVIQVKNLRKLFLQDLVTIFLNYGNAGRGWVAPLRNGTIEIDLGNSDKKYPEVGKRLQEMSFDGFSNGPMGKASKLFCRMVHRAKQHLAENRQDEACLHFVIALDTLFGERNKSNETVIRRAAVATHGAAGKELVKQMKHIESLYDKRSRYVHGGLQVGVSEAEQAEKLTLESFWCLVRASRSVKFQGENGLNEWFKQLDYFASAMEAGHEILKDRLEECGVQISAR
jgi:hypothetical protein